MIQAIRIGMIGDYDPGAPSHPATNAAIAHAAEAVRLDADVSWIGTERWAEAAELNELGRYDALWATPGSPYRSFEGALEAIRFARERGIPFTGT